MQPIFELFPKLGFDVIENVPVSQRKTQVVDTVWITCNACRVSFNAQGPAPVFLCLFEIGVAAKNVATTDPWGAMRGRVRLRWH